MLQVLPVKLRYFCFIFFRKIFNELSDPNTMAIYEKILRGKVRFPRNFDSDVKSLIKHLLTVDASKRYGSGKQGAQEVKNHRWFAAFDWCRLLEKALDMPHRPVIKTPLDSDHFASYPDSDTLCEAVPALGDPFIDWS